MPRSASQIARARFAAKRRRAQVDTGIAEEIVDVEAIETVLEPEVDMNIDAPVESDRPFSPVSEPEFEVATDSEPELEPANPPVFPAEEAPEGEGYVEPTESVTATRAALIGAMSLVEARVAAGLEPRNVDKVALADRFARTYTVREMKIARNAIREISARKANVESVRGLVPRRSVGRPAFTEARTASVNVPDEAIFDL